MKTPRRVGEFIDMANWRISVAKTYGQNVDISLPRLRTFVSTLGTTVASHAFCANNGNANGFFHRLHKLGYRIDAIPIRIMADGTRKGNVDPLLAFALSEALSLHRLQTVVLGTGDIDFLPLVEILVHRGIEVIVIGPTPVNTASELVFAASRFYSLSDLDLLDMTDRLDRGPAGKAEEERGAGSARTGTIVSRNGTATPQCQNE